MTIKEMTHAFLLALADYEQADMHGTFVKVPRQAVDETLEHVTRLTDEVEQLREVLEWYGDPENYKRRDDPYGEGRAYPPKIVLDNGDKARDALTQEPRT